MEREELAAWLRLTLTPGVGNETARKLLAAFGLPDAVFRQSSAALRQVVSATVAGHLRAEPPELPALLDLTWTWLQNSGEDGAQRHIVVLGDADYPVSLLRLEDPPLMLYLLGAGEFISNRPLAPGSPAQVATNLIANSLAASLAQSIAVVGSRNPTPQGAVNARLFSKALGQAGLTIVSGLALGVDGAAHEGALDSLAPGSNRLATVAVVGTGLDRVYPKAHLELAHRIAQHGLLNSEYPLGTLAHHGPTDGGTGQGCICHSRLDSFRPGTRLPRADQAGRQTGGVGAGCAGRAETRRRAGVGCESHRGQRRY
jgi:DNA processing protein